MKILVVDDNPGDAKLVHETLLDCDAIDDFEIIFATCIKDLYKEMRDENNIDLVILDLGLPDIGRDGILECIARIAPRVAIIVLTGGDGSLSTEAIESGAQDYLIKNELDGKLLERAITYALGRQKLVLQLHEMNVKQEYMATHDQLTGLVNRSKFDQDAEQLIEECLRDNKVGAILFLDLDGFKLVNDSYGHAIGDQLLISVADRISNIIRATDICSKAGAANFEEDIARIGGDEFVILLKEFNDLKENVYSVAKRIIESVGNPYKIGEIEVEIGASIGISFFPEHGNNLQTLLNAADKAMYISKQRGKSQWCEYEED